MRTGVITCSPEATIEEVARMMAMHHVHAVVVTEPDSGAAWGIVSDLDVIAAAADADTALAGACAAPDVVTVSVGEWLRVAARLMEKRGVSHLVVAHPGRTRPVGVLSTLDVARVIAFGR
jgi:CBS domain-containing protein